MTEAIVVRQPVTPGLPYSQYREELRYDFWFSCAYCSMAEAEAQGLGFEIDHYEPVTSGGSDDYENLFWSCTPCNRRKLAVGTIPPTYYFIRIDRDNPADHYTLGDNHFLVERTETGRHNIIVLQLNRLALRALREQRERMSEARDTIAHGLRFLSSVHLDDLPKQARAWFVQARDRLRAQAADADVDYNDLIRERCRSRYLDRDPDQKVHTKARRDHLRSIGALVPRSPKK